MADGNKIECQSSCDMVLGIQWLETLGPICWDFKQMTMKFDYGEIPVVLKASMIESLKSLKGNLEKRYL